MKRQKKLLFIIPLFLLFSCGDSREHESNPKMLLPQPVKIVANPQEGYALNQITGVVIQPIVLKNGDTLVSGKHLSVTPKHVSDQNLSKPNTVQLPVKFTSQKAHLNKHPIPSKLTKILVNTDSLITLLLPEIKSDNDTAHYYLNSTSDTVFTGIPIPIVGKKVPAFYSEKKRALPPRHRDAIINDMRYMDVAQGLPSSYILCVYRDKKDNIWFGTSVAGVSKYDGTTFTHFLKEDGLGNNTVQSILEDREGNLWFGTAGGGISKYDGEQFVHFTENEGLSSNEVWSMLEDRRGNIWFGTDGGGIIKYDGKTVTHYTEKEGLSSNYILSILEDKIGNIWIGTSGEGVCKFDGNIVDAINDGTIVPANGRENLTKIDGEYVKSFTHFTEKTGLSNNVIMSIEEDQNGTLWFGTYGGGVNKYDGEYITYYTDKEGLSNNYVRAVHQNITGDLWIGTDGGGVNHFDGQAFVHYTESNGLNSDYILSIEEDKTGKLWFGSYGGGVSIFDDQSFTHYTVKEGLSNNTVRSILEDKNGLLWFGTYDGGVTKYDGDVFSYITENEGLGNNTVWSIIEDRKGNLWFGTYGGGVSKYDGNRVEDVLRGKQLNQGDRQGLKYVAGNPVKTITNYTQKEGLISNDIWSMMEDVNGNIWFGTDQGVCVYDGEMFSHYTEEEGLGQNFVRSIVEDRKGNVWFGTNGGGVTKYDGNRVEAILNGKEMTEVDRKELNIVNGKPIKSFFNYTEKEGLSNNIVRSILEDHHGNLWFGTDGGVCKFDGEYFVYFTEKEGLTNNIVWALLEDRNGAIWVSTENGLNQLVPVVEKMVQADPISNNKRVISSQTHYEIYTMSKYDGLKGVDFFSNSACLDTENRAWWGCGKSLTMLDLNNYNLTMQPFSVSLRQLDINGQYIDYRHVPDSIKDVIEFSSVEKFENYPIDLILPYSKNHLTFHFSAIDWKAPHKIKYSFLLTETNSSWSAPSHEAKVDYRNIPYGTHTFKIRAIGENSQWSKPFTYTFTISPPWWYSWWAYVFYFIVAGVLIWFFVKVKTKRLIQHQVELEKEVENATNEINGQKQEIEHNLKIVEYQKEQVEMQHQEITDSITYAKRLQNAILPSFTEIDHYIPDNFVFFQSKDVVSGDFYWFEHKNDVSLIAVADCTGHGVPGAIVSVVCSNALHRTVNEFGVLDPAKILDNTRDLVIETFAKSGENISDGMDIALCAFSEGKVTFAGANNPLWIVRKTEYLTVEQLEHKNTCIAGDLAVVEFKGDRQPIGLYKCMKPFSQIEIKLIKGDVLYFFSDGFADQFGGQRGKKMKYRPFKRLLIETSTKPIKEQKNILKNAFDEWKGNADQLDDVCVVGIKIR